MKFFQLLLLFLLQVFCVFGQNDLVDYDKLTTKKGLSNNAVSAVFQDKNGFLWIGTHSGLNRYSGYGFTIFTPSKKDSFSIIDRSINCIFEDKSGKIWIGTDNGLSVFDPTTQKFYSWQNTNEHKILANNTVSSISEDKQGKIWIATFGGISIYDPKTAKFSLFASHKIKQEDFMLTKRIEKISCAPDGKIWIGTLKGLYVFNPQNNLTEHYVAGESPDNLPDNYISSIFHDAAGHTWVGTRGGLVLFDGKNIQDFKHNPDSKFSIVSNLINQIDEDVAGNIWVATDIGVSRYDKSNGRFQNYRFETDLEKITCLLADATGMIWCGTSNEGIYKLDPFKYKFQSGLIPEKNEKSPPIVWSVIKDKKQNVWLGTGYGLFVYDRFNATYTKISEKKGSTDALSSDNISALALSAQGNVWVGTFRNGLNLVSATENAKEFKVKQFLSNPDDEKSLSFSAIKALHEDKKGNLWVGTLIGLNKSIKNDKGEIIGFQQFFSDDEPANGLLDNNIQAISEDSEGNIWVGTASGVNLIAMQDGQTVFKSFPAIEKIKGKVQSILQKNKNLWIGTNHGLYKFDLQKHTTQIIEEEDVFFDLSITGIVADSQEFLWVTTNDGLYRINEKNLKISNYGVKDGLPSLEFSLGAAFMAADNEILLGNKLGFTFFKADSLNNKSFKPKVLLQDFKIFNESIPFGNCVDTMRFCLEKHISYMDEIVLSYQDYVFSFDFIALSFRQAEKNEYAYKMEGFDSHWNYVGTRRTATYSNLPAGEYVFLVKAANSEGVWNDEAPTKIKIVVKPPFWQTIWFILLVVLLVIFAIYGFIKLRIISIENRNRSLEIMVKEHTIEIIDKNFELEKQKSQVIRAYDNVRILSDIGRKITSSLHVEEVTYTIYQNLNEILDANGFGIGIYNEDLHIIRFDSFIEESVKLNGKSFSVRDDIDFYPVICFLRKETIFIKDVEKEHALYSDKPLKLVEGKKQHSIIYVPLFSKEKIFGVLTVQSFQKNAYSEYQLSLLESLATYISTALDNAKAYSKIEQQKVEIEENTKNLHDSINYARLIQHSMLPDELALSSVLGDSFVLLLPKDIVSGDFYWFSEFNENGESKIILAAVDCTGHGVPGAFMSMAGHAYLNQIVNVQKIVSPDLILHELHKNLFRSLKKGETHNKDGMDLAICVLDRNKKTVEFAGAKNPLLFVQNGELTVIKGDRDSIGGDEEKVTFNKHVFEWSPDMVFYMISDGYEDQFGGPLGKKIMRRAFYELLRRVSDLPMDLQKEKLLNHFNDWKLNTTQIDDVLVIGFRINALVK